MWRNTTPDIHNFCFEVSIFLRYLVVCIAACFFPERFVCIVSNSGQNGTHSISSMHTNAESLSSLQFVSVAKHYLVIRCYNAESLPCLCFSAFAVFVLLSFFVTRMYGRFCGRLSANRVSVKFIQPNTDSVHECRSRDSENTTSDRYTESFVMHGLLRPSSTI